MKQRITVLGSTGSVGANTLDVIARHPDRFRSVRAQRRLAGRPDAAQCVQFKPQFAVMASEPPPRAGGRSSRPTASTRVLWAPEALEMIASHESVDTVMAAIVGAAGLASCLAAARAGKRLLLANKEALVVGGELFMQAVRAGGAKLLPIDSEHSAIFQSLPEDAATWGERVEKIILTASGGPFRTAIRPACATSRPRGLRPPELGDGPQDLGRLGHHDEQGPGGDRGALPVRPGAGSASRW
jgi:1-deoxy-D-xylulose-5-phosphate reductoisomerase